jgi:hypothetical protein
MWKVNDDGHQVMAIARTTLSGELWKFIDDGSQVTTAAHMAFQ